MSATHCERLEDKDIKFISALHHLTLCLGQGMASGTLTEWISGHENTLSLFRQEVGGNSALHESGVGGQSREVM